MGKLNQDELIQDKFRIRQLGGVNVYIWINKLNKDQIEIIDEYEKIMGQDLI